MKKTNLFIIIAVFTVLLLYSIPSSAKIWRVNNRSNYNGTSSWGSNFGGNVTFPVFKQIDEAVAWNSVVDSDTIHVEGSPNFYAHTVITKRLVIIGPGYFLSDNPKTSNDLYDAKVGRIEFSTGSNGSVLSGINVEIDNSIAGYVVISADSITVKRCKLDRGVEFKAIVSGLLQKVTIIQNYFPEIFPTTNVFKVVNSFIPPVDIIFNNNICKKTLLWEENGGGTAWAITECKNNIFDGPDNLATPNLRFSTSNFSNNILMPNNAIVDITAGAGLISYNIGTQTTQFGTAFSNLVVPTITTLFIGGTSNDGYYQIQSGTQAYQNGSDGADRGAFGGAIQSSRYTLSGLTPVPVVYEATSNGVVSTTTGLPVTVKARTIK